MASTQDSTCSEQPNVTAHHKQDLEEGSNAYRPGGFHPVYIGGVYHNRYKIMNKIGYGAYSTVWLARDLRASADDTHEFIALKVLFAESYGSGFDIYEREILKHLRSQDQGQLGYSQINHVDDFEHQGPNGTHVCMVFELIGETLRSFGAWFPESMIPNTVMRRFTIQLLLALDFSHDHGVIHTDIQPSNIFVKMRDHTLIKSGYLVNVPIPQQDKGEETYTVIPSQPLREYYFNRADKFNLFDITLGDWGVSSWADNHLTEIIQPIALRAPEVLIGAPWDATTDFWNLGALILELFRAVRMFSGEDPQGHYKLEEHLAEIVHLFGPFPKALLDKANQDVVARIFDDQGRIKNAFTSLNWPVLASTEITPGLKQEDRDEFVSFLQFLMKIDPTERPTPEDLLRHPWLGALPRTG